ncbi:MAG TPA: ABC transporter substrate-binding protein [bacterium]|nr:ABC transporter substrate-binding protein [bacterium]
MTRRDLLRWGIGTAASATSFFAPRSAGKIVSAAQAPKRGGTLVYASSADIISLDPAYGGDTISSAPEFMIYDYLVRYTPDLRLKPDLAVSWVSEGTTWTFKLRQGVTFTDGTRFNAGAVKAHFDRMIGQEKPFRASYWVPYVESVAVIDDATVQFRTKFTDAAFLTRLAGIGAAIESPAAFQQYGKDLARHPVGTGPFKFVEWVDGERLVMVRNDNYWGSKALLDQVTIRPIADDSARMIALTSGDVQLVLHIPPELVPRILQDSRLTVQTTETLWSFFVGMNVLKKPFSDLRVRQALNYAADQISIVRALYGTLAEPLHSLIPRGMAGYATVTGYPHDAAKAQRLLADAGYPKGFSTHMVGPKGRYLKDYELEQAIQQQLQAIGVTINLETVESARYLELIRMDPRHSPLEMWFDAWSDVDAVHAIETRFGCQFFRPTGANTAGFCDADLDRLTTQAERTSTEASRDALLRQAQDVLAQQVPAVWLLQPKETAGMSRRLHNPILLRTGTLTVNEKTWLEA